MNAAFGQYGPRREPGYAVSAAVAAAMHLALFAALVFGMRWQNAPPAPLMAELWSAPPAIEPPPVPAAKPAPPPPPETRPEPRIEKPDIVLKAPKPVPKPEPKAESKPAPKPAPKPEAEAKAAARADEEMKKRLAEELAREQSALAGARARQQVEDRAAAELAAAQGRALAGWVDRIRAKVRGNILLPVELKGNPEAVFDVVLLPTGEVLTVRLRRSSGVPAWDEAVERALLRSSPLPLPEVREVFRRDLEFRFRLRD